jgi:radical SAM superfamily enzyme YgiQ (UPF0313 family)
MSSKEKKIALINPNYNLSENIGISSDNSKTEPILLYPPLGLLYLASCAEMLGHKVSLIDMPAANIKEKNILRDLGEEPDIVGIYTNTFSLNSISKIIEELKSELSSKIILGGPHLSYDSSIVKKMGADYGFLGDSERSFMDFLRDGCKSNKKIIQNKSMKNLDEIPFPSRHLLDRDQYISPHVSGKVTSMITSRGCPFDCVFCFHGIMGYKWRARSPRNIVDEIDCISNSGIEYIEIEDDFFTFSKTRVIEICKGIVDRGIKISFGCETRADFVDQELISWLKKAGCVNIQFGIESGSEKIRERIGKRLNNDVLIKAFRLCKEIGMSTTAYFMFGHPGESRANMLETIEFAKKLNPTFALFHITRILPGSRLFKIALEEGLVDQNVWNDVRRGAPVPPYVPKGIDYNDMVELQNRAWKEFYMNPRTLGKIFTGTSSANDFFTKVKSGIRILKMLYR